MATKPSYISSAFQSLDTGDYVVILIAISFICISWPSSVLVVMLGMLFFPMYLIWRVVECSLKNLT